MNRPGFLLDRKCEGTAVGPDHFRLKELQDLAKLYNVSYTGLSKDTLCARLREFYLQQELASSFIVGDIQVPIPSSSSSLAPSLAASSASSATSSTASTASTTSTAASSATTSKKGARLPPPPPMYGKKTQTPMSPPQKVPSPPKFVSAKPSSPLKPVSPKKVTSPGRQQSQMKKELLGTELIVKKLKELGTDKNSLSDLKPEIIWNIVKDFDINDLQKLCQTNKTLYLKLCGSTEFWRQRITTDFGIKGQNAIEKVKEPKNVVALEEIYKNLLEEGPDYFFSDTNPQGYIRKLEYRNVQPEVPFLIFNLERQLGDRVNKSRIEPTHYIGIGDASFIHKATVIFSGGTAGGHYTTVFNCSDPEVPDSDNWYAYDDIQPRITLIATSHEELLKKRKDIITNGVLHFYTNADQEVESPFSPCATLGPQYFSNSCYMDSTLLAIFSLSNQYLLNLLLNNPLTDFKDKNKPEYVCPKEVKQKIRGVLENMLEYFLSGETVPRKFCTDLRPLFNQCRFRTYESFGNTAQRSPSEFLSYLFQIFGVTGPGLIKYTWGTNDLDANHDSLFDDDNPDKEAFIQTSVNDTNFNYVIEVGPYKLEQYNGGSTNDLLASVDDIILI